MERAPKRKISARTVRAVCERLEDRYGKSRLGNPADPVDDLIYVTLSNRTAPKVAKEVYRVLKQRYANWDEMLRDGERALSEVLAPAGLSKIRGGYIMAALTQIKSDFGKIDIRSLSRENIEVSLQYLTKLPGVSGKVARCIMMYTLGHKVLPVDVHVHRIAIRLGWTDRKRADQCHDELEALVPPDDRYLFHVACVQHGRSVCRPRKPDCTRCCIRRFCRYYMKAKGAGSCDR